MRGKAKNIKTITDFHMTEKAIFVLKQCIDLSGEDVHNDDYDLFKITQPLERLIRYTSDREALNLGTTYQIMYSIEYLKKEGLI